MDETVENEIQEYVEIAEDAIARITIWANKKINRQLKAGGCPANNIKCHYLRGGVCVLPDPELEYSKGKLGCFDCVIW